MSIAEPRVADALEAVRILGPNEYAWLGVRFATPGGGDPRSRLVESLQGRLYADCYCRGGPVAVGSVVASASGALLRGLSAANRGTGCWDRGWKIAGSEPHRALMERDGLRLLVDRADVADGPPGEAAAVRLPREFRRRLPGFYIALGDHGFEPGATRAQARLYWHVRSDAAPILVDAVTRTLNLQEIPFRLKVASAPALYGRCDAAVLYLDGADRGRAADGVAAIHHRLAGGLGRATPLFARRLAPGLAFAEDPGGGESFGVHRCGLLAEAIVRAHERGVDEPGARLSLVAVVFAEAGLRSHCPHLNPGSGEHDDWPWAIEP